MTKYVDLRIATLELRDYLTAWGVDLPFELKRRDPEEPGRERKEQMEDKLYAVMMRQFRWQKKRLRELLQMHFPGRKTIGTYDIPATAWDAIFENDGFRAELLKTLTLAAQDGVLLFSDLMSLEIDYTMVNTAAAEWARKYSGQLIKNIYKTTKKVVGKEIAKFIETPGYSIGDIISELARPNGIFSEQRAFTIAVTETTNAYGSAEQIAGIEMQKEFPDIQVIKTWFTSSDDRVCLICGPLHNVSVPVGEKFIGGDGAEYDSPAAHPRCRCSMSTRTDITGEILEQRKPMEKPEEWENPYVE